jgi:hypothetical protein
MKCATAEHPRGLVVPGELEVVALRAMPTATWPMPDQESSQVRSAWSARSYEGREHPAKEKTVVRTLAA